MARKEVGQNLTFITSVTQSSLLFYHIVMNKNNNKFISNGRITL